MFTSRAEYRLSLRADNADQRLTPRGIDLGVVGAERASRFGAKREGLEALRDRLRTLTLTPDQAGALGVRINKDGIRRSAYELMAFPEVGAALIGEIWPETMAFPAEVRAQIEIEAGYAAYVRRQEADIKAFRRDEGAALPQLDVDRIPGLSNEVREKLKRVQPRSLGQASRIEGMTPAALGLLLAWSRRAARDGRGVA